MLNAGLRAAGGTAAAVTGAWEEEEGENNPPPEKRKKKRAASSHPKVETPKKGNNVPVVNTAWDVDSSPERRPRTKPQAAS